MSTSESITGVVPARRGLPRLGAFAARHRRSLVMRKIAGLCRRYLDSYDNLDYDPETNGEAFVLRTLGSFSPRILVDAGANVGEWTLAAREHCADAEIHALEVAEPTFRRLQSNLADLADIHCANVGLSDQPGKIQLRHYPDLPTLTTAIDYPHPFPFTELTADVVAGDAYAEANGLEHIDFLKIDVEGMEAQVLRGFDRMFGRRAIDLVQFEYGRVNIVNRFFLRDFYDFFEARGYAVGQIFPTYVDFRDYELSDEDFMGPNYLACRRDKPEYLRALAGSD